MRSIGEGEWTPLGRVSLEVVNSFFVVVGNAKGVQNVLFGGVKVVVE